MKTTITTALLLFFTAFSLKAQSDNCSGAPVIPVGGTCTTQTYSVLGSWGVDATLPSPTCGTNNRDGYFQFTATSTSTNIEMNDNATNGPNAGLMVLSGSCGALTQLACSENGNGILETAVIPTVIGQTYFIVIFRSNNNTANALDGTICVYNTPTNFTMTNGNITACSGTFFDPGSTGDYGDNQDFTYTICPSTPGAKLQALFTSFSTESCCDYLTIYDGSSTSAPTLGTYNGTNSPGTVQATPSNPTGCLTFVFHSDISITSTGWEAVLSCIQPCQTITSNFVSSNEAPGADGVIRLCQGQSVNLVGSGTFSNSGTGATYVWSMGNGVTVTGTNINYTYPSVGSYSVNLTITDPSGCTNTNAINRNIQVSTTPTITTSATPATLCTNQTSAFAANVTMTPYTVNCTPPVSGTTFLPDGSGVSYQTSITTNCFNPTQTITQISDFNNVCLTMEHSFLGDLQIELICPNGQTMILKSYAQGGGGTYLGNPIDDVTSGPGTGRIYCFTPTATTLMVNGATSAAGTPSGSSINGGNYMPTQSFSNLIGCPLNGAWTIRVTDNLSLDDGYIFNWDVNFNAALTSATSFTPTIVSQGWVPAANLTSTSSTTANVVPTATGNNQCFTYSVTDNFGCTYTQPQCINVNCTALPVGLLSFDATAISNDRVQLVWETATEQNNDFFLIERSSNGLDNWELVANVKGAGNSNSPRNYMSFDEAPLDGISYYRLSQFDFDGARFVADVQTVLIDRNLETGIEIFPNPSRGLVQVRADLVSLSKLQITDANGKNVTSMVKVIPQNDASVTIDLRGLSHGVYTIKAGEKTTRLVLE